MPLFFFDASKNLFYPSLSYSLKLLRPFSAGDECKDLSDQAP